LIVAENRVLEVVMQASQFIVIVHSEEPGRLVEFYRDVVGLTPRFEITPGAFSTGSSGFADLIVEPHSEVRGAAREPQRLMLNFVVEDAVGEEERLKSRNVPFVRDVTMEPGVGLFGTFTDPDGNYCQLIELR
jgi:predicted enzyme related to lactoylglutathione lyase